MTRRFELVRRRGESAVPTRHPHPAEKRRREPIDMPDGELTVLVTFNCGKSKYAAAPLVIDR